MAQTSRFADRSRLALVARPVVGNSSPGRWPRWLKTLSQLAVASNGPPPGAPAGRARECPLVVRLDDAATVAALRAGDEEAFELVVRTQGGGLSPPAV